MRVLPVVLVSAVIGVGVGAALAYVEVTPYGQSSPMPRPAADLLAPLPGSSEPRVEVDEPQYDFGTMQRGTTKSHAYVLRNVGQAPLTLRVGHTTCKCTLGEVRDEPVLPGESVEVNLEWTAKSGMGPFRQEATVVTNDPLHSRVVLTVSGEVTEPTGIYPREFLFETITAGQEKTAELFVMSMFQDDLEVSDPVLSNDRTREFFDVRIEPVARESLPNPAAKQGVRVTLTAKQGLPLGRVDQWLSLRTNLQDAEKLEIPVIGRVVGNISVYGNMWSESRGVLLLGHVKSDEGASATLNLVVRGEGAENVKLEIASRDPPELMAKLGKPRRLKAALLHVPLTIEIPAGTRPMAHLDTDQNEEAHVVLKTSLPEAPELVLSVRFTVER